MPAFIFRAAAALDVRRTREEQARRARGEAAAALARAEAGVHEIDAALCDAIGRGPDASDPAQCTWYRNWITRLHLDRDRRRAMMRDRRVSLDAATAALAAAHRDVRALERLRDRAWAAWQNGERLRERRDMDWLGTLKHAQRAAAREEQR